MHEPINILLSALLGGGAILICFLAGYWFNKINNRQDSSEKEIKEQAISQAISDVELKNMDENISGLRIINENLSIEFRNETISLAREMKSMVKSITIVHQKTQVHDIEIRNIKDGIGLLSNEIRKAQ
jgi:hypothetical protein